MKVKIGIPDWVMEIPSKIEELIIPKPPPRTTRKFEMSGQSYGTAARYFNSDTCPYCGSKNIVKLRTRYLCGRCKETFHKARYSTAFPASPTSLTSMRRIKR